jgi:hypothetical protein
MMWVIRGTSEGGQDFAVVVETDSRAAAEWWGLKRGMTPSFVGQADENDVAEARRNKQLWKYTPDARHMFLGRPVGARQMLCFLIAGVATIIIVYARTTTPQARRFSTPTVSRSVQRHSAAPVQRPVCGELDSPASA